MKKIKGFLVFLGFFAFACMEECKTVPCQEKCFGNSCDVDLEKCLEELECPEKCRMLAGDLICEESCNIHQCLWDGLDCRQQCSEGCRLNDLNNGRCEQACFNEDCQWDGNDCLERKLSDCDCSLVNKERPVEYFVGKTKEFSDLKDFFQSEICCEFVSVIVEDDSYFNSLMQIEIRSENLKVLTISTKNRKIMKIGPFLKILVFGASLTWKNFEFQFNASSDLDGFNFQVFDDGKILFEDCDFQGRLGSFIQAFKGTVAMQRVDFSGEIKGKKLLGFERCDEKCQFFMENVKISGIFSDSKFFVGENTEVHAEEVLIENSDFQESIFDMSRHSIFLNHITIKNSTIHSLISGTFLENLSVSNLEIKNSTSKNSLFSLKYSTNLKFSSITISNLLSSTSTFHLIGSDSSFSQISIINSTSQSFLLESSSTVDFSDLSIKNSSFLSSALNSTNSQINLKNSFFSNLSNSAIFLSSSEFSIVSSSFINCSSDRGGAAVILNSCGKISESLFRKNKALKKGGALFILSEACISISKSQFDENESRNGGAFFSSQNISELNNTFIKNKALQGNDRASSIFKVFSEKTFESARPGQEISGEIKFRMVDVYNQTVLLESVSWLALSISNPSNLTSISGTQFNKSTDGVFLFTGLSFYGTPGSTLTLEVDLFCDDPYCRKKTEVQVEVPLSHCLSGEVLSEDLNSCVECEKGFYSFRSNEKSCRSCPDNAECYSNKIVPKAGYWHSTANSSKIFKCINQDSCLNENRCEKGYTGNLCAVCASGYIAGTSNTCKECPSKTSNIILIVFLTILFVLIITYIIYRTYEDAYEPKLYHSVLIKILMNYFQLMMLTSVIKVRWPEPFYDLISIQEQIGSNTGKLLSVDCLIQTATEVDPYYINQLASFLAPLVLGLLITLLWSLISLFISNKARVLKPLITSLVVVFFILHPGISSSALSIVSCYELEEGEYWNTDSFNIQCFTEEYGKDYYAIFVLDVVFWTIGMPVVAYVMLWKNRNQLDDPSTKAKYGFLYHGYHGERFYWEFIIMLRKLLIISVAVVMRNSTVSLQLIFVLIVLLAALALNQFYKPFELDELNRTENYSIILSIICLTSGLMIEAGASKALHIFLFIVLVVSNLLFFCYFAKRVYQAVGHYLWSTCPNIARNICPNAQRPKIKIREILQKEERKNRNKKIPFEPQSGFVENNKEVVIQMLNMRHFADFYNEVLAARFSGESIKDVEEREMIESENNQAALYNAMTISESRPFFRRIFTRKRKNETVQQKILNIRKQSLVDHTNRRVSSDGGIVEAVE